jgi:hypothetical protein
LHCECQIEYRAVDSCFENVSEARCQLKEMKQQTYYPLEMNYDILRRPSVYIELIQDSEPYGIGSPRDRTTKVPMQLLVEQSPSSDCNKLQLRRMSAFSTFSVFGLETSMQHRAPMFKCSRADVQSRPRSVETRKTRIRTGTLPATSGYVQVFES